MMTRGKYFSNKYQIIPKGNFCKQSKLLLPFRGDGREVKNVLTQNKPRRKKGPQKHATFIVKTCCFCIKNGIVTGNKRHSYELKTA